MVVIEQVVGSRINDPLDPRLNVASSAVPPGKSAASWAAIIAGAFVAASVSLILLALGSGFGFASISPWLGHGVSATTFTINTAIWLIVTQWVSAGMGGYIAGRLRTRWVGTHTHEVFFRDTAHGLITWSVATVLVAVVFATSVLSLIGGGARAVSDIASAGAQGAMPQAQASQAAGSPSAMSPGSMSYDVDRLFRPASVTQAPGASASSQGAADARGEAGHIIAKAIATGSVPDADRGYLAELVAARTGASAAQAQRRVDDFIAISMDAAAKARAAADAARKAAAEAAIFLALSMLIGAFIASVSAALGGRLRDEAP